MLDQCSAFQEFEDENMIAKKKLLYVLPVMALGVGQAALANNGRYDRGYANGGLSEKCVVTLAYNRTIAIVGPMSFLTCLHPN